MRTLFISLLSILLAGSMASTRSIAANSVVAWGSGVGTNYPAGLADVKAVAGGENFSLALLQGGTVVAWGNNTYYQTNVLADLTNAVAIAAGRRHGLAVRADGTVVGWGKDNSYHTGRATPPAGLSNVVAVAAGEEHSLALKKDGSVVSWGGYWDGSTYSPMTIGAGLKNVAAIAAGYNHDVLLLSNGLVVADGWYGSGQTEVPGDLANVVAIAAGGDGSVALTRTGAIVPWGSTQTAPSGLTDAVALAAGSAHDLALRRTGTVRGWGDNSYGQATPPSGLSNVVAIAGGAQHSLALVSNQVTLALSIVCPTNMLLAADAGQCSASNVTFVVAATGGSGAITLTSVPPSGSTFPVGITTVTNTATDGLGNSTNCTFAVTVVDTEPPVIACPGNRVLSADEGQCSKNFTFTVGASDNCGSVGVVSVPPSGSDFPLGTTTVTNTATDLHGNKATCTFTITITENEPPVIDVPANLVLASDPGQCSRSNVTFQVTATDNCGSAEVASTPPSGSTFPLGTTTVNNRATDSQGNSTNRTFTVMVMDSEPPLIVCPPDMRLVADTGQHCKSNVTFEVTATDNCGSPSLLSEPPSGSTFPVGTTVVTNTATDNCGNRTTNTFSVTVTEPRVANTSLVAWGSGLGTNCPTDLGDVKAIAAGEDFSIALLVDSTVVAWGTQLSGRTNTPPDLTSVVAIAAGRHHGLALRGDGTVAAWPANNLNATPPAGLTNVVAVTAGEEHSLALKNDGTVLCWGKYYFAETGWTSTNYGPGLTNVAAISAGYNHDLLLLSNGVVLAQGFDGSFQTDVPVGLSNVVAIAAGGDANLALTQSGALVTWGDSDRLAVPAGVTNVIVTQIDAGYRHALALRRNGTVKAWGNDDLGQATVPAGLSNVVAIAAGHQHSLALVNNAVVPAPSIVCPANLTLIADAGQCGKSNVTFVVEATGGSGALEVLSLPPSGSTFPVGATVVTNIATDGRGSSATCTFTVTVTDVEPPTILCPTNLTLMTAPGQLATSNVTFTVSAADNCTSVNLVSEPPNGSTFPLGTTTVTNTATDSQGNVTVATFTVTVSEPPSPPFSSLNPHRTGGVFTVSVSTVQGRNYRLEYKNSLLDAEWTPLPAIPGDGTVKDLSDPSASGQRFYRVKQF